MSTRATLVLVGDWHLFQELADDGWHTWLEFPMDAIKPTSGGVALRIPSGVWKELRTQQAVREHYLDMPLASLLIEAESWVAARMEQIKAGSPGARLGGSLVADPDASFDEQVKQYIAWYTPPSQEKEA